MEHSSGDVRSAVNYVCTGWYSVVQCSVRWDYLWSTKAMAPHSSTLAWKIPWTEECDRLQSMGSRRVRHEWVTSLSLFTFMHWRRKWHPLQCSWLENPRDGGAWWAAIYGVAQSWTRLKWLSSNSIVSIGSESVICTHISSPSWTTPPYSPNDIYSLSFGVFFPFRSSQHWVEFPMFYSRFSLGIYFTHSINSVYISLGE